MNFLKKNLLLILLIAAAAVLAIYIAARKSEGAEEKSATRSLPVVENDVIIATLTIPPEMGDVLTGETLQKIRSLHRMLEEMKGIKNISSLVTATVITTEENEIFVKRFIPSKLYKKANAPALLKLRQSYSRFSELKPYLSGDLRSCSFYIEPGIHYSSVSLNDQLVTIQKKYRDTHNLTFDFTGLRPIKVTIEKYLTQDILSLLPIVIVLIVVLFLINFRSLKIVGLSFLVILVCSAFSFGVVAALDLRITPLIVLIPAFNAGLLTDYLLHLFYHTRGATTGTDIIKARNHLVMPLLLTAVSTVIGFLSMMLLSKEGHQLLGLFTSLCVISTYILTIQWLPGVIDKISPRSRSISFPKKEMVCRKIRNAFFNIFHFIIRKRIAIYIICALFLIVSIFHLPRIIIQPYPVHQISGDSTIRKAESVMNTHFAGTIPFSIHIDTGENQSLTKRKSLETIEKIHTLLKSNDTIGYDHSYLSVIKRIHYYFNNSNPDYNCIPKIDDDYTFQTLIEQYLILYTTMASPEEYESLIDPNFRYFSINGVVKYRSQESLQSFRETVSKIETAIPASWKLTMRGPLARLDKLSSDLRNNWIFSFMLSLLLIFITVLVFYRNLKLSLISLFPSLVSVVFTTGVIAIFNIEIDIYTIIFIAVTMGLTIDYTIHIIVAINELKNSRGMQGISLNDRSGIEEYFSFIIRHSGIPVFLSFLTSLFSFGILMFSSFKGARFFGMLISLSLVISILFSVVVLPALLIEKNRKSFK